MDIWCSLCSYQMRVQYKTLVLYLHTCSEPVWLVSCYILNEELAWQHQPDRSCLHLCAWQSTFMKIAVILDALSTSAPFTARGIFRKKLFPDLRNIPSGDVRSLSLAHKLTVSPQVLIGNVHIFTNNIASRQKASESWIHRKIFYYSGKFYSRAVEK